MADQRQVKFQLGVDARTATRDLRHAGTSFKSFSKGLTKDITHASNASAAALGNIGDAAIKQKNIVQKAFSGLSSHIKGVFMRTVDAVHFEITQRLTNAVLNSFHQMIEGGGELQDEFEAIMTGVQKTAGLTYEKSYDLGMELRRLASEELSVSAAELARAADVAAHLGIVNSQAAIKDMTKFIVTLSDASLALPEFAGGVEQIADVIGKQLNIFGQGAEKAEEFLNVMDALSNTAATDAAQISEFMATFTEAKRLGLAQHQVAALGASLTSLGKRANAAGTQLQTAFLNLMTTGMDQVQELLGDKGFDRWQQVFLKDKIGGLEIIMERLRGLGEFEASQYMNKIFGKIGLKAVGSLIDPKNFEMIKKHMKTAADQSRLFAQGLEDAYVINREMEILQNSQRFYADRIRNAWNEVKIIMAERIEPLITGFNKNMAPVLTAFANLLKGVEELRQTEEAIDRIGQAGMTVLDGFKNILVQLGIFRAGTNQLHFVLVNVFDTILSGIGLLESGVSSFGRSLNAIAGLIGIIREKFNIPQEGNNILSNIESVFDKNNLVTQFEEQHGWLVKIIVTIRRSIQFIQQFGSEFTQYLGADGRTQLERFSYLFDELGKGIISIYKNMTSFISTFISEVQKSFSVITAGFNSSRIFAHSLAIVFTSVLTVMNNVLSKITVLVRKVDDAINQFRKGFEEGVSRGALEKITFHFTKFFNSVSYGFGLIKTHLRDFGSALYTVIPLSTRIGDTWDLLKVKVQRGFESIERLYLKHFFGERLDKGRVEPVFTRRLGQQLGDFVKNFPYYLGELDKHITKFSKKLALKIDQLSGFIVQSITYIDLSFGLFQESIEEKIIDPVVSMATTVKSSIEDTFGFIMYQIGMVRKGFTRGFLEAFGQDSIEKVKRFVSSLYGVLQSFGSLLQSLFLKIQTSIQRPLELISYYYESYLAGKALGTAARVIVNFGETVYNVFEKVREVFQKVSATDEFKTFTQNLIRLRNLLLNVVQKVSPPYLAMAALFVKLLPLLNKVFSVIRANSGVIIAAMSGISVAVRSATEDTTTVANWIVTHVITPVNDAFLMYDETIASFRETIKKVTENVIDLVRVFQWWFTTEFGEEGIELLRQNMENLGRIVSVVSDLLQTLVVRFRDVEKQEAPNMFQQAGSAARELARGLKLILSITAQVTNAFANVLGNIRPFIEGIREGFGREGVTAIQNFSHNLLQALLITRDILTTIVPEMRGFFDIFKSEGTASAADLGFVLGQVFLKISQILEGLSKDLVKFLTTIKTSVEEMRAYFDLGFFGYMKLQISRLIKNFKLLGTKIVEAMSPVTDGISSVINKLQELGIVAYGKSVLPEMTNWFGVVGESAAAVTDGIADLSKEMGDAGRQDMFGPIEVLGERLDPVTKKLGQVKDSILEVKKSVDEKVQAKGLQIINSVLTNVDEKFEDLQDYKKGLEESNALIGKRERYGELYDLLAPIREVQDAAEEASAETILHSKAILKHQIASRDMTVQETRAIADYLKYQEGLKQTGMTVNAEEMGRVKDQLREMYEISEDLGYSIDRTQEDVVEFFNFDYMTHGVDAAMLEFDRAQEKQNVFVLQSEKIYDRLIAVIDKVKMSITGIIDSLLGVQDVAYGHSVLPELVNWFTALLSPINAIVNQVLILAGAIQGKLSLSQAIIMSLSNLFGALVSPIALVVRTLQLGVAVVREFLITTRDLLTGQVTLGEVVFGTMRDLVTALTIPIQVLIGNFMQMGEAIRYIGEIAYGHSVFPMLSEWLDIADTKVSQLADSFSVIGATIGRVMIEVNKAYSQSISKGITPEFFDFDVRQILDPMLISEGLGKFEYDVVRFITQAFADLPKTLAPIMYDLSEIWREFSSLMVGTAERIYDFGVMVKEKYLAPIGEGLKEIGRALVEIYTATRPLISIFTYMWGDWILKIPAAISLVVYFRKEVLKLFTDPQAVLEQFFDTLTQRIAILETAFKRLYRVFKGAILAIVPQGFQDQVSKIFQNFEKEIRYTYDILRETASKTVAQVLAITDKVFTWINEKTRIFDFTTWIGNQISGGLELILSIPKAILKTITYIVDTVSYTISALATTIWVNKDRIWDAMMTIKDSIVLWGSILSDTAGGVKEDLHSLFDFIVRFATSIPGRIAKAGEAIGNLIGATQNFFHLLKTNPVKALSFEGFTESLKKLFDQFGHFGDIVKHVLGVEDIDKSINLVESFGDSFAKAIAHAIRLRNLLFTLGGVGGGVLSDLNGWFLKIQNWYDTWFGLFKVPARFRATIEKSTKSVKGFEMSLGRISRIWHDITYALKQNSKWIDAAIDGTTTWNTRLGNITKEIAPQFAKLGKTISMDFAVSDFISAQALDQLVDAGDLTDDLSKAFVQLSKDSPQAFEYDQMNKFSKYLVRVRKQIGGTNNVLSIFGGIVRDIGSRLRASAFTGPLVKGLDQVINMFRQGGQTIRNFYKTAGGIRNMRVDSLYQASQSMAAFLENTEMGQKSLRQFIWTFSLDSVVRWGQVIRDIVVRQKSALGQWIRGTKIVQNLQKQFEPLTYSYRLLYRYLRRTKVVSLAVDGFEKLGKAVFGAGTFFDKTLAKMDIFFEYFSVKMGAMNADWARSSNRIVRFLSTIGGSFGNFRRLLETELYNMPVILYDNYFKIFNTLFRGSGATRTQQSIDGFLGVLGKPFSKALGKVLAAPYKVAYNFAETFINYMREPVKAIQQFQKVGEMYAKPITIITSRFSQWGKAIASVIKYFNPLGDIFKDVSAAFRPLQSMPDTTTILMRRVKAIFPTLLNIIAVFAKWKYVLGDFVMAYKTFVGEFNEAGELVKYPDPAKAVGFIIAGLVRLKTYAIKIALETADQFAGLLQQGLMMFLDDEADKGIREFFGNIRSHLQNFMRIYEDIMTAIPNLVGYVFSTVQGILQGQITEYTTGWERLIATITLTIKGVVGTIIGVFDAVTRPVRRLLDALFSGIEGDTIGMWKNIGRAFRDFLIAPYYILKPLFKTLGQYLAGMVGMAGNPFESWPAFAKFAGKAVIEVIKWSVRTSVGIVKDLLLGLVTSIADVIWTIANPWTAIVKLITASLAFLAKTFLKETNPIRKFLVKVDQLAWALVTPFSTLRNVLQRAVGLIGKLFAREPDTGPVEEYSARVTDIKGFAQHTRDAYDAVGALADETGRATKETENLGKTAYGQSTYPDIAKYAEIAGMKVSLISKITEDVRNITRKLGDAFKSTFKPVISFLSPIVKGFTALIERVSALTGGLLKFGDVAYGKSVLPETYMHTREAVLEMRRLAAEVDNTSEKMSDMYIPGSDVSKIAKLRKLFEVQNDVVLVPNKASGVPETLKGSKFDTAMQDFGISDGGDFAKFEGIREAMVDMPDDIGNRMKASFDFYLEHTNKEVATRIEAAMDNLTESEFYKKAPQFLEEIRDNLDSDALQAIGYGAEDVESLRPAVSELGEKILKSSDNIEIYLKEGVEGLVKQAAKAQDISDDSIKTVLKIISSGVSPTDIDTAKGGTLYKLLSDSRKSLYKLKGFGGQTSADFAKGSALFYIKEDILESFRGLANSAKKSFSDIIEPIGEVIVDQDKKFFSQYATPRTDIAQLRKFTDAYTMDVDKAQEVFTKTTNKLIDFVESADVLDDSVKKEYVDKAASLLQKSLDHIRTGSTNLTNSLKGDTLEVHALLEAAGSGIRKFGAGIGEYTTTSYRLINNALSGIHNKAEDVVSAGLRVAKTKDAKKIKKGFSAEEMTRFLTTSIVNLTDDLNELDNYVGTTYRTLNLPNKKTGNTFIENLLKNSGTFELDRMTSTTMKPEYAVEWGHKAGKQILMAIEGSSGKGLGPLASYAGEMEVLLKKGVKLNLTGAEEVFDGFAPKLLLKFKEGIVDNADVLEDALSSLTDIVKNNDVFTPFKYDYVQALKVFSGPAAQSALLTLKTLKNGFLSLFRSIPDFTRGIGNFFSKLAIENTSFLDKLGRFGDIVSFVAPIITAFRNGEDVMQGFARGLSQIALPLTAMFTKGQGIYSIFGKFVGKLLPVFGTKLATVSSGVGTFIMTLEGVSRIGELVFGLLEKFISRYPKLAGILPIIQGIHSAFSKLSAVFDVFYKVQEKIFFTLLSLVRRAGEYIGIWKFIGGSVNLVLGAINKLLDAIIYLGDVAFGNSVFPDMVMWIEKVKDSLLELPSPIELGVKALQWFGKVAYGESVLPETEKRVIALQGEFNEARFSVHNWTKALAEAEKGVGAFAGAPGTVKGFLDDAIKRYENVMKKIPGATRGGELNEQGAEKYFAERIASFEQQRQVSKKERFVNLDPRATIAILEASKAIEEQSKPGLLQRIIDKAMGAPASALSESQIRMQAIMQTGNNKLLKGIKPEQTETYFKLATRALKETNEFKLDKESLQFLSKYDRRGVKGAVDPDIYKLLKEIKPLAKRQLKDIEFIERQSDFLLRKIAGFSEITYKGAEGEELTTIAPMVGGGEDIRHFEKGVYKSNLELAESIDLTASSFSKKLEKYIEAGGDEKIIKHLQEMIALAEKAAPEKRFIGGQQLMREAEMKSMEKYMKSLQPSFFEKAVVEPMNRLLGRTASDMEEIPRLIESAGRKLVEQRAPVVDELDFLKITDKATDIEKQLDYMRTAYVEGSDHLVDELATIGAQIYDISPEQFLTETIEGLTLQRQTGTEGPVGGIDIEMLAESLRQRTEAQIEAITTEGGTLLGDIAHAFKATRSLRIGELGTAFMNGLSTLTTIVDARRIAKLQSDLDTSFVKYTQEATSKYYKTILSQLSEIDPRKAGFLVNSIREATAGGVANLNDLILYLDYYGKELGLTRDQFARTLTKQQFAVEEWLPIQPKGKRAQIVQDMFQLQLGGAISEQLDTLELKIPEGRNILPDETFEALQRTLRSRIDEGLDFTEALSDIRRNGTYVSEFMVRELSEAMETVSDVVSADQMRIPFANAEGQLTMFAGTVNDTTRSTQVFQEVVETVTDTVDDMSQQMNLFTKIRPGEQIDVLDRGAIATARDFEAVEPITFEKYTAQDIMPKAELKALKKEIRTSGIPDEEMLPELQRRLREPLTAGTFDESGRALKETLAASGLEGKELRNAFRDSMEVMAGDVEVLEAPWESTATNMKIRMQNAVKGVSEAADETSTIVTRLFSELKRAPRGFFNFIVEGLTGGGKGIRDLFQGFDKFSGKHPIITFFYSLPKLLLKGAAGIGKLGLKIVGFIGKPFLEIAKSLDYILGISANVANLSTLLGLKWDKIGDSIRGLSFRGLLEGIQSLGGRIGTLLADAVKPITNLLTFDVGRAPGLKSISAFMDRLGGLTGIFKSVSKGLLQALGPVGDILDFLQYSWSSIVNTVQLLRGQTVDLTNHISNLAKGAARLVLPFLEAKAVGAVVAKLFGRFVGRLLPKLGIQISAVAGSGGIAGLLLIIEGLAYAIRGVFGWTEKWLLQWKGNPIADTLRTIIGVIRNLADFVVSAFNGIYKIFEDTFMYMFNSLGKGFQDIVVGVLQLWESIKAAFRGDWSRVWETFKDGAFLVLKGLYTAIVGTIGGGILALLKSIRDRVIGMIDYLRVNWKIWKTESARAEELEHIKEKRRIDERKQAEMDLINEKADRQRQAAEEEYKMAMAAARTSREEQAAKEAYEERMAYLRQNQIAMARDTAEQYDQAGIDVKEQQKVNRFGVYVPEKEAKKGAGWKFWEKGAIPVEPTAGWEEVMAGGGRAPQPEAEQAAPQAGEKGGKGMFPSFDVPDMEETVSTMADDVKTAEDMLLESWGVDLEKAQMQIAKQVTLTRNNAVDAFVANLSTLPATLKDKAAKLPPVSLDDYFAGAEATQVRDYENIGAGRAAEAQRYGRAEEIRQSVSAFVAEMSGATDNTVRSLMEYENSLVNVYTRLREAGTQEADQLLEVVDRVTSDENAFKALTRGFAQAGEDTQKALRIQLQDITGRSLESYEQEISRAQQKAGKKATATMKRTQEQLAFKTFIADALQKDTATVLGLFREQANTFASDANRADVLSAVFGENYGLTNALGEMIEGSDKRMGEALMTSAQNFRKNADPYLYSIEQFVSDAQQNWSKLGIKEHVLRRSMNVEGIQQATDEVYGHFEKLWGAQYSFSKEFVSSMAGLAQASEIKNIPEALTGVFENFYSRQSGDVLQKEFFEKMRKGDQEGFRQILIDRKIIAEDTKLEDTLFAGFSSDKIDEFFIETLNALRESGADEGLIRKIFGDTDEVAVLMTEAASHTDVLESSVVSLTAAQKEYNEALREAERLANKAQPEGSRVPKTIRADQKGFQELLKAATTATSTEDLTKNLATIRQKSHSEMSSIIGNLGLLADMTDEQLSSWAEGAGVSQFVDQIKMISELVQEKIEPKGIESLVTYLDKEVIPVVEGLGSTMGMRLESEFKQIPYLISNPFNLSAEELEDSLDLLKSKTGPQVDEMINVIKRGAMLSGNELTAYISGLQTQFPKYGKQLGEAIQIYIANTSGEFEKAIQKYPNMLKVAGRDMKQNVHDFEILVQAVGKAGIEGFEEFEEKWGIMVDNADKPMRELMEAIELGLDVKPLVAKMRENGYNITNEMVDSLKQAYTKAATQVRPLTKEMMEKSLDALNDPSVDIPRTLGNWMKTFDVGVKQAFTSVQNAIDAKTGKLDVEAAKEVLNTIVKQGGVTADQANFVLEASIAASEQGMLKLRGGLLGVSEEVAAKSREIINSTYAGVTADTQASMALVTQALTQGVDEFGAHTLAMAEHSKSIYATMTESQQKTYDRTENLLKRNKGNIDIVAEAIKSKFNNNLELAKQYVEGVAGAMEQLKTATDDTTNSTESLRDAQKDTYIKQIALMYQKAGYSMEAAMKKGQEAASRVYSDEEEEKPSYAVGGLVRYAKGGRVPAIVNERGQESLTDKVGAYGKRGTKYPLHHVSLGLPGEGRGGFAIGPDGQPGLAAGTFVNTAGSAATRATLSHARGGFIKHYAGGGSIDSIQSQIKDTEARITRIESSPKYNDKVKETLLRGARDDLDKLQTQLQQAVTAGRGSKQYKDAIEKTKQVAGVVRKTAKDTKARTKGKGQAVDEKGNVYEIGAYNSLNREFGTDELKTIRGGGYASWTTPSGEKVLVRVNPGGTKQYATGKGKDGKLIWSAKEDIHKKNRPTGEPLAADTKYYDGETVIPEGAKKYLPLSWDHKRVRSFLTFFKRNMTIPHIKNDPAFMKDIMVREFGADGITPAMAEQLYNSLPKYAEGGEVSASELATALFTKNQKVIGKFMSFAAGGKVPDDLEYVSREQIESNMGQGTKKPSEMTMEELAEANKAKHDESVARSESDARGQGAAPVVPGSDEMIAQVEQIASQRGNVYKQVADAMVALRVTKEEAEGIGSAEQAVKMMEELKEKKKSAPKLPGRGPDAVMGGAVGVVSKSIKNVMNAAARKFGSGWRNAGKDEGGETHRWRGGFDQPGESTGGGRKGGLGQPGGRWQPEEQGVVEKGGLGARSSREPTGNRNVTWMAKVPRAVEDARKSIGFKTPEPKRLAMPGRENPNAGKFGAAGASGGGLQPRGVDSAGSVRERLAHIYKPLVDNPFKSFLKSTRFAQDVDSAMSSTKMANAFSSIAEKTQQQTEQAVTYKKREGLGAKSSATPNESKYRSARLGKYEYPKKQATTAQQAAPKALAVKTFYRDTAADLSGEEFVRRYKATYDIFKGPLAKNEKSYVVRGLKYIYGKMRGAFGTKEAYYWAKNAQGESTVVGKPKVESGVLMQGGKKVDMDAVSKFGFGGLIPSVVGERGPELLYRPGTDSLFGIGTQGAALQMLQKGDLVLPNKHYKGGTIERARSLYNAYAGAKKFADGGIVHRATGGGVGETTNVTVGDVNVSAENANAQQVGPIVQAAVEKAIGNAVKKTSHRRGGV